MWGAGDLDDAAEKICASKIFDNSTSCSSENALVILDDVYEDAIAALERADVPLTATMQGVLARLRYAREVFCVPPWAEIFGQDAERKHSFEAAVEEYEYLTTFYAGHGYEVTLVPKLDVAARADWLEGKMK